MPCEPYPSDPQPKEAETVEPASSAEQIGADQAEVKTTAPAAAEETTKPAPKKRGRKSKAELAAIEAAKIAAAQAEAEAAMQVAAQTEPLADVDGAQQNEANGAEQANGNGAEQAQESAAAQTDADTATPALTAEEAPAENNAETPRQQDEEGAYARETAQEPTEKEECSPQNKKAEANATYDPQQVEAFFARKETDFIIMKDIPSIESANKKIMAQGDEHYAEGYNDTTENRAQTPTNDPTDEASTSYDFSNIIKAEGVLELNADGTGFLRSSDYNYLPSPDDIFVNANHIKRFSLKTGDVVEGFIRPPRSNEKFYIITQVERVNGCDPEAVSDRSPFESLTPLFPDKKFQLCSGNGDKINARVVDLFAPIGKGQRALIVAQPKTGKTILMKDIANAIAANHPEAYLIMLLVDERPEEVTDMARTVNAEVIASTFDEPAERHVRIANIVLEKAKRMVECGQDVVIFLDSITRLARAYNTVQPASGKILTGGVDANAMHKPKRFFGAARNIEGSGSLTIIATALIDTGSRMDEVIFEEFKGTGNMELQLERSLANKRIFPAVNIIASSTRRDDLLHDKMTLDRMWILRKFLADMNPIEAMSEVKSRLEKTQTNEEFLQCMNS
ncbi:MAG: transcription termination factor Rho [Bacteroidales bacterium]|nr:transcription termination factor Rho [Candidatus Physcousia equi]